MKLSSLKSHFTNSLSELYPSEEIGSFFSILSEKFLKLSRVEVAINPDKKVSEAIINTFENCIARLKHFEPIQYIIGETEFYGLPFKVTPHTLIPRPETEELVEWIVSDFREINPGVKILDIGTGSGCIAISLAKNISNSCVTAIDISKEALIVANENADLNNVDVTFELKDILASEELNSEYDIIVSNPPYVRELEKEQMQANVLKHEPNTALFVSNERPLVFYEAISKLAIKHLKPNGFLYFEINEYLSKELVKMLKGLGYEEVIVRKDLFGRDRMIKCTYNGK
ncbi:peptide chain release factor N(5)-glutamine methyltransferase [Ulvibacter antarcticus]|uniref:Release factor glutamine methyltransferase n=1 Tax=Ulvibacter antarcticus TaxID=442714 RepID=A0A3L9YYJ9_9FLAO|nr:peptide chain release factor N(5)-glutamine methyltransferase [Ulvibacter antarcticus]RMA64910.1 release factor glutamine methyltransferase [Ulvibacter antarcticus]